MKKLLMLLLLIPALIAADNCPGGQCALRAKRQVVKTPAADQSQAECTCNKKKCRKCNARKRAAARQAKSCAKCYR